MKGCMRPVAQPSGDLEQSEQSPERCVPSTGHSVTEITDQHLIRQAQLVHEMQRMEDKRGSWQKQVTAELTRAASGTLETARNIEALKKQLDRVEVQLAQLQRSEPAAGSNHISRTALAASLATNGAETRGAASADAVSALGTLVSATGAQLQSAFSKRLAEMEQRANDRLTDIHDRCVKIHYDEANLRELINNKPAWAETQPSLTKALSAKMHAGSEDSEGTRQTRDPLTILEEDAEKSEEHTFENGDPGGDLDEVGATLGMMYTSELKDPEDDDLESPLELGTDVARCFRFLQIASSVLIGMNLAFVGMSLLVAMPYVRDGHDPPPWLLVGDIMFLVAFIIELLLRLAIEKMNFVCGPHKWWNAFEATITVLQLLDVAGALATNLSPLRFLRGVRLMRAVRLGQQMSSFRDLRLLVALASCWQPFFWGSVALFLMTYLFAVFIAQWLTDWRVLHGGNDKLEADPAMAGLINRYYGTLWETMITLFMAITGGVDWETIAEPLRRVNASFPLLLVAYVSVMVIGIMNILTAVYVERFMEVSHRERDLHLGHVHSHDKAVVDYELRPMLEEASRRFGSGKISRSALHKVFTSKECRPLLRKLKLEVKTITSLCQLLDGGEREKVSIDGICFGILHMKGSPATMHMAMVLFQTKKTLAKVDRLHQLLEDVCTNDAENPESTTSHRAASRMTRMTVKLAGT